jgi:hypothetical protein
MLCRVALVRTDVAEELSDSIIRVTRIGELGKTIALTINRRTLRRNTNEGGTKFIRNVGYTRATQRKIPEDSILEEFCLLTCDIVRLL